MARNRLILVACLVTVAGVAGAAFSAVGGRGGGPPGFKPVQYARATGASAAAAGVDGRSLPEVLLQLRARVGDGAITQAGIGLIPATASSAGGSVVSMTVNVDLAGPMAIRRTWEAELIAGALRDVAAERGLGQVDNFLISTRFPDGSVVPADSGFGNVVTSQLFDASSDSDIAKRITAGLTKARLKPISVSFVPVLQSAPVVIASGDDPAAIVDASHLAPWWTDVLGDYDNYEGYYLELRDQDGNPFLISTAAHRAGSSSAWMRPDLRSRSFSINSVPTGSSGG